MNEPADMMSDGRRDGFTLLELLIVIIVMAILMGILLPVFVKTREAAYKKRTKGDCRTLLLAALNYNSETRMLPVPDADIPDPWPDNTSLEYWNNNYEVVTRLNEAQNGKLRFIELGDYSTDASNVVYDAWRMAYKFTFTKTADSSADFGRLVARVASAGPDRQWGTGDDIVSD